MFRNQRTKDALGITLEENGWNEGTQGAMTNWQRNRKLTDLHTVGEGRLIVDR